MIMDINKVIAYICPMCSEITVKQVNVFEFSGAVDVKYQCIDEDCLHISVEIQQKKDKYKIEVACPICEENHNYFIKKSTFWQNKLLELKCPTVGVGVFFAGTNEEVHHKLTSYSEFVSDLLDESDVDNELNIIFNVIECINDLSKLDKIQCVCKSNHITVGITETGVSLTCQKCGKTKNILITHESLQYLMSGKSIWIGDEN